MIVEEEAEVKEGSGNNIQDETTNGIVLTVPFSLVELRFPPVTRYELQIRSFKEEKQHDARNRKQVAALTGRVVGPSWDGI